MTEKNKKSSKDTEKKPAYETPKKETPLDKKVLDKKGRDFSRPKFFKKDGEV